MTEHERALAALAEMWAGIRPTRSAAPRAYAALRAVLAIHVEHQLGGCAACDEQQGEVPYQWPCPTVRAIAEKLEATSHGSVAASASNGEARALTEAGMVNHPQGGEIEMPPSRDAGGIAHSSAPSKDGGSTPPVALPDTPRADHEFLECFTPETCPDCHRNINPTGVYRACNLPRSAHPRPEPAEREHTWDCREGRHSICGCACHRPEPAAGDPLGALPAHVRSTVEAMARALEDVIGLLDSEAMQPRHLMSEAGASRLYQQARAALASWRGLTGGELG